MSTRGIGGIFFKAQNPRALRDWYSQHLGLAADEYGATIRWREFDHPERTAQTVWNPFPADTEYFDPSSADWMINFRVENLAETLERLADEGVEVVGGPEEYEYGEFGWILDLEGNKIELWEPTASTPVEDESGDVTRADMGGAFAAPPGTTMAAAGDLSDRSIDKECTVDLPVSEVWRLWTTSSGMAEWWVPDNHIELRVGGPLELYFMTDQPEGKQGSENCRILSFLPEKMLSFTWNAPPNLPYTRPRHTHVVLQFEDLDGEKTGLELHHTGWPDADWDAHEEWAGTFAYFDSAWDRVLDLLVDHGS